MFKVQALKTSGLTVAFLPLILFSANALADDPSNWYAGANLGQSSNSIDHNAITSGLYNGGITTGGGLTVSGITDSNESTAYRLFGGYQLTSYFGIEAGYFDFGKLGYTANTTPAGSLTGELKIHGVFGDGILSYPVDSKSAVFLRGGVTFNQAASTFSNTGAVQLLRSSYNDNSTGFNMGLGGWHRITEAIEIRFEGERDRLDDSVGHKEVITLVSLGLAYRF
jgi:OOP family OmpA-OmpF porin